MYKVGTHQSNKIITKCNLDILINDACRGVHCTRF